MKNLTTLLLFLIVTSTVFAGKETVNGYYVKLSGDTVKGTIEIKTYKYSAMGVLNSPLNVNPTDAQKSRVLGETYPDWLELCSKLVFFPKGSSSKMKFKPKDIIAYGFVHNDSTYHARSILTEVLVGNPFSFAEVLADGKVQLYKKSFYMNGRTNINPAYFLYLANDPRKETTLSGTLTSSKEDILKYFEDNPTIAAKIKSDDYKTNDLVKYVQEYNGMVEE